MIEFKNVCASYTAETPVLDNINFTIEDGEFVAFVGTNGAGKSTTMRLCNGLLKPTSGEVLIDGVPTTQMKTSELARRVGFLFQNPDRQICSKTVREELEFGFKVQGMLDDGAKARIDEVIENFGFNPDDEPYLLNRGKRQLLALASIIVMETPTIILDEPTTGLDYLECEKVMEIIARLHSQGKTIIMVCHDMEVVGDFAKRMIVLTKGEMVADGPTFELMRNRDVRERAHLIAPQIIAIGEELIARNPRLASSPIATANTLEELTRAIQTLANGALGDAASGVVKAQGNLPIEGSAPQDGFEAERGCAR